MARMVLGDGAVLDLLRAIALVLVLPGVMAASLLERRHREPPAPLNPPAPLALSLPPPPAERASL